MTLSMLNYLNDGMAAFLLVFFRMTGVVLAAPMLANPGLPPRIRVWFAFALAVVVFPIVQSRSESGAFLTLFRSEAMTVLAVGSELAIGWVMGWTASIALYAAQFAGHIVGQEVGISIGDVFDPITQTSASPYANLFLTVATLVFVVCGGHLALFEAVVKTFDSAPIGGLFDVSPQSAMLMARDFGSEIFSLGLRLALPTMLALLIATISMAILARAVPEMNIFIVGFTIRIVAGLFVVVLMVPLMIQLMTEFVSGTTEYFGELQLLWERG
ncbi:MAG: flagellar biosynthetic protein FliR [Planctomycetes bacterium]|nr:flagellar biosynthetic protein FliR [Planctomycetota bacterium]